jgi:uncharacterized membrane protein
MSLRHHRVRVTARRASRRASRTITAGALALLLATAPARAGEPSFTGIGIPHGAVSSFATGVSFDGSVVCGNSVATSISNALRWTDPARGGAGFQVLGHLPGASAPIANAKGISADGRTIVGRSYSAAGAEAFRWTDPAAGGAGMQALGDLPGANHSSEALAVSADGRVVAGWGTSTLSTEGSFEAFRWTDPATGGAGMVALGDIPGALFFSMGTAITPDGATICGHGMSFSSAPHAQGAYWPAGSGPIPLPDLPGGAFGANCYGISADGHTIVGTSAAAAGVLAFRWTDPDFGGNGIKSLGNLPGGFTSYAYGVSADGNVVLGHSVVPGAVLAVVWTKATGMRSLHDVLTELGVDFTGWKVEAATAISGDGRTIVGNGTNPAGKPEGWVVHLGSPWQTQWNALAGSTGEPVLMGSGTLVAGAPMSLSLSGARPSSAAALIVGLSSLDAPFKGGVLVPTADVILTGLATSAAGAFTLAASWPAGVPSDFSFWSQAWIADPAGPQGYAASNGLTGTTP